MKKYTKILLFCGALYFPIYFLLDFTSSILYRGYNYKDQAISELSAIGAPTKPIWSVTGPVLNVLLIAFGIGIWRTAQKRSLRLTGILILAWGIMSFGWSFFPMNMRGNIGSVSDTGHLFMAGLTVLLMTIFIAIGSGAKRTRFRIYSILTILVMLAFGGYVGMQAPKVAAQLPTPWMGIMERIGVFSPMIWVMVLAIFLLRDQKNQPEIKQNIL